MQALPKSGQLQYYKPFGISQKGVVKGNLPSKQKYKQCTWFPTLLGKRNGQICDYILIALASVLWTLKDLELT